MARLEADVVIIGGGPAGAAMGCYLSRAGISNVLFDKAVHPRPHVGESLVTSTTRIFDELDFLPVMEREGFVRKYGASWHPPRRSETLALEFREFPQEGIHQDYTWHVDRAKFDLLLLEHAQAMGTRVHQGVGVRRVLFDEEGRARGVVANVDGEGVEVPARLVVDASGRSTVLGSQLGCKDHDPNFNQFAVHAWFEGVDRGTGPSRDHIHIHFLPVERGWVWQIPITETVTSMGVVAEKRVFKESKRDFAAWFRDLVRLSPDIARAMAPARRVNEFKVEADYSYVMDRFCGDGFVLVGDAARFVDPIFSSGVSVALYSAKFASERIADALARDDVSRAALEPYERRLKRGTAIWYEFITLYYKLLPLFTYFVSKKDYRLQVLQLLQGEVYDRDEVPVLNAMREYIAQVEKSEKHLLKPYLDSGLAIPEAAEA